MALVCTKYVLQQAYRGTQREEEIDVSILLFSSTLRAPIDCHTVLHTCNGSFFFFVTLAIWFYGIKFDSVVLEMNTHKRYQHT